MDSSQGTSACAEQERIEIPNSHNEKLVGLLHETGSRDVVVLCHGFRSNKNDTIMKSVAAAIEKEGISAFRFDFSGNGESEGSFAMIVLFFLWNIFLFDDFVSITSFLSSLCSFFFWFGGINFNTLI
ncbi:hypothetical protein N665_0900s0001 [Sinapis alba]|nr:hypothetical protein N665_0900s0001 [Sinapis alba]